MPVVSGDPAGQPVGGVVVTDVLGAVREWFLAVPGWSGPTGVFAAGWHFERTRSPSRGCMGVLELPSRQASDVVDRARVTARVLAVGGAGQEGARAQATRGALAVARIVSARSVPLVVETRHGLRVRIVWAGDVDGPTQLGDVGGEISMGVDFTVCAQPG